jgi:hypothetical protein
LKCKDAVSTGNGERDALKAAYAVMVAHLRHYQRTDRMSTKKIEKPISKDEAAQILLSAVGYCQKSGMKVLVRSVQGKLVLFFDGLELAHDAGKPMFVTSYVPLDKTITVQAA